MYTNMRLGSKLYSLSIPGLFFQRFSTALRAENRRKIEFSEKFLELSEKFLEFSKKTLEFRENSSRLIEISI